MSFPTLRRFGISRSLSSVRSELPLSLFGGAFVDAPALFLSCWLVVGTANASAQITGDDGPLSLPAHSGRVSISGRGRLFECEPVAWRRSRNVSV